MKKTIALAFSVVVLTVSASVAALAGGTPSKHVNAAADHEGKPCHVSKCNCRSCYGNNWGNYYCLRCKHDVKKHY